MDSMDGKPFELARHVLYEALKKEMAEQFGSLLMKEAAKKDATTDMMLKLFGGLTLDDSMENIIELSKAIKVLANHKDEVEL